jgi:hypothetical protein
MTIQVARVSCHSCLPGVKQLDGKALIGPTIDRVVSNVEYAHDEVYDTRHLILTVNNVYDGAL